jgi:TPP-dependent pyruvate/acetoin dehydrogenase alpha subunit
MVAAGEIRVMNSDFVTRRAALADGPAARLSRMVEIREFENRVNDLFAEGVIHGTTHLCLGQEALAVGLASAAHVDDVVAATYRGHGIALALGMTPDSLLAEIMGKASGCTGGLGGSMHLSSPQIGLLPTSAIIGAGMPIAVGAALAFQNRGEPRVAVSVFGDGGANIGAFHEAINIAAVWKLPIVFVCDNNLYGEYSRINLTTAVDDIHKRAAAYAIPGEAVDGMDLDAVTAALGAAIELARGGGGPTLIEAKTYRFAGHSRADQATYRPAGEAEAWRDREPVDLLRRKLSDDGTLDDAGFAAILEQTKADLEAVVERARAAADPTPADMFANVWSVAS